MTESNFSKITYLSGSYSLQFYKICKTVKKEGEEYKLMFKICITARKTKATAISLNSLIFWHLCAFAAFHVAFSLCSHPHLNAHFLVRKVL